jgi:hypothetical protein
MKAPIIFTLKLVKSIMKSINWLEFLMYDKNSDFLWY